jgi:hypothetical protein
MLLQITLEENRIQGPKATPNLLRSVFHLSQNAHDNRVSDDIRLDSSRRSRSCKQNSYEEEGHHGDMLVRFGVSVRLATCTVQGSSLMNFSLRNYLCWLFTFGIISVGFHEIDFFTFGIFSVNFSLSDTSRWDFTRWNVCPSESFQEINFLTFGIISVGFHEIDFFTFGIFSVNLSPSESS